MMLIVPWDAFSNALILQLLLIVIWIIALAALVVTVWSGVQYAVVAAHAMKKQNGDEA